MNDEDEQVLAGFLEVAIKAAEEVKPSTGFSPYSYVVGFLLGNLPEEQCAAFEKRLDKLGER